MVHIKLKKKKKKVPGTIIAHNDQKPKITA